MTTLWHPPIDGFVTHLKERFQFSTLVETGTFQGDSTLYAAERFKRVITIDKSAEWHAMAFERCAEFGNVEFAIGDTRLVLPHVVASLRRNALFWLDAHAAPGLFGDGDDWPALDELKIINQFTRQHFILIDDAHCFLPGSPYPACPTFDEIHAEAQKAGYLCRIAHDVIAMVPGSQVQELDHFARPTQ